MCGITGILAGADGGQLYDQVGRMVTQIVHRGPDDQQIWVEQGVAFGHARLAIQDLSPAGRQPMESTSGRYVIAFNGEIYNFLRLKQELSGKGCIFRGGSDTEVVLAGIETWGLDDALQKFEGMFAFSMWDRKKKELLLCRDRIGEKPLFYGWHQGKLIWASELKAFQALPGWQGAVRSESVSSFLKYGYVPTPYSIYQDIYKLVPGCILRFRVEELDSKATFSPYPSAESSFCPQRYWDPSQVIHSPKRADMAYHDAVEELDGMLNEVIRDQMISDVPYGAFLSGGIDSSTVASIMQSQSIDPIRTFTIGFDEKDYNEAPFAAAISRQLGTEHNELTISSTDCLDLVPRISSIMDEPFADSSILPAYFVSKMARERVTVCLSGDAGDELFCGYNRYIMPGKILHKMQYLPPTFRKWAANLILTVPANWVDRLYHALDRLLSSGNTRVGLKMQKLAYLMRLTEPREIYDLLISFCRDMDEITDFQVINEVLLSAHSALAPESLTNTEAFMAMDMLTYLPDDNLTKVDRTSMVSSLETRLPLLNHKVVEFAWSLPLDYKFSQGVSKRILRDVLYKRVPRELIDRPKMGFSVPVADWLRGPLKTWAMDLLQAEDRIDGLELNQNRINRIWKQHQSGQRDHSLALWALLMFKSWNQERLSGY